MQDKISDESIDLTVTSPPYDNLRKYNGYDFDFENIAQELYRVTKKGGVVVWIVGDATIKGSETGNSFKQALYFKEKCGFNLHDTMIYKKQNPIPQFKTSKRYTNAFEYIFVFSKGKPKTFNPIEVPCKHTGKKHSGNRRTASAEQSAHNNDGISREIKKTKTKENIWEYKVGINQSASDKIAYNHPAIFPEKLAEDHIISWSNERDIIFDPMCGSGTTPKMALANDRNYIGIDISEKYCEIARKRLREGEHE